MFMISQQLSKWLVLFTLLSFMPGHANSQTGTTASFANKKTDTFEWHYTVRPKDNVWSLGDQFLDANHSWGDIIRHNNIKQPNTIATGTILKIPISWLKHQPAPALAASVSGNTMLRRHLESQYSLLEKNTALRVGDEITTYEGSVLIKFADKSILRLSPNSNLVFNRLTRYGKTGMADTRLRLQKGRLSTHVTPLNHQGSRYEINTPSAVAAVRGTAFRLMTKGNFSQLEVTEGIVNFSNASQSIEVNAGQGASLTSGSSRFARVDLPKALYPQSAINNENIAVTKTDQLPITLKWLEQQKITTYYYQLFKDSEEGELIDSSFLEKPEIKLNHLTNGTYLVAMRAIDNKGFNGLDHQISIVIGMIAKSATLLEPANDTLLDNDMPEFTWQYNSKNELSQLQLAKDFEFNELVSTSEYAPDNTTLPSEFLLPGEYYWRVKTLAGGNSIAYSNVRRLKIRGMLPPSKIISVNYVGNRVKIFWNTVPQAERYVLQLAEDYLFENIIHEDALTSSSANVKLTEGKRYFARVKGVGNNLFKSEFSTGKELHLPLKYEN
jgi:hypothetical protein